jgi:hypothetical protein
MGGHRYKDQDLRPALGKNLKPYLKKIAKSKKWVGDMAQVVKYIPSKQEALSSNPITTKKKNK